MTDTTYKNWKLIIGLGNPGKEYSRTYHNAGTMAIDCFSGTESDFKRPFSIFRGQPFSYAKGDGVIFIKPLTFMNDSGRAVKAAMRHFGASKDEIVVLHDDSDLPLGEYKIESGRGSAGHNGINSIIQTLGTKEFWRIRIGVRSEKETAKAADFVLKKMPSSEINRINQALFEIKARYFEGHNE